MEVWILIEISSQMLLNVREYVNMRICYQGLWLGGHRSFYCCYIPYLVMH